MQNSYLARPDLTASAVRPHLFTRPPAILFLLWTLLSATCPEARAQTGTVQWSFVTGGSVYSSPALGSDGTIYFGSRDSKFYAVKPNGSNRWDFAVGAEVWGSPALGADDTIYFGSQDGKLHALRSNGLQLWEFNAGKAISSTPAVEADGSLYVTCTDGKLYAVSAAGAKKWEYAVGADIRSSPAVGTDGTIYFGARDGKLHAVNANGSPKWEVPTGGDVDASPSIGPGGVIYFGSADGKLYAVSQAGVKLWEYATGRAIYSSAAVGVDGAVYVGGYDAKFYAVTSVGTARWITPLGYGVASSSAALAADGSLYVGASEGRFFSLSATGTTNWVVTTGGDISFSSPAIASDGTLYVGSDDGKLYAIKGTTGPAVGAWPMFHRDARRTGDGFVDRILPGGYSPGEQLTVTLRALPPAGVGFYVVEDSPPANWQVGEISDDGYWDAANRRVRFGPFTDGLPRLLSYQVTPPQGETGLKQFAGISAADGLDRLLGGDHVLSLVPAHPADRSPVDNWLTVGELTAYGAAWKRGTAWPTAPSLVPSSYLDRAIALWQEGEFYTLDTNFVTAPFWWVGSNNGTNLPPLPLAAGTLASNGVAAADMPLSAAPGTRFRVTVTVTPSTNVTVYAVEDQPPAGWEVSGVDGGGHFDRARWNVKWGPYFDHEARTNSYWVTVAASAVVTNRAVFAGVAAFDASQGEITGQRVVRLDGGLLPSGLVTRKLPAGYSPGMTMVVSLQVVPLTNHLFYVVEDRPPTGWVVGQISDEGTVGSASRNVRFGPFFDGQARVLTYELTPPLSETGTERFSGTFSVDGIEGVTGGDTSLDPIPLHPADVQPIDTWLTIREMTAYGAAWKRGTTWQSSPNPIPAAYITQAIDLWRSGEYYRYDTNFGDGPYWWVSSGSGTNSPPLPPDAGTLATNGAAVADMPLSATPGTKFRVTVTATPSTNVAVYAVEDQPPAGWEVSGVDGNGYFDRALWKVKWGPYFDHEARTNSYWVTVAASAAVTNRAVFAGVAAFDASQGEITGQREVRLDGGLLPSGLVTRTLPAGYSPGMKMVVNLQVAPLINHLYYMVEDVPPTGWLVGQISDDGTVGSASRNVRFGPFFDGQARVLTYELTPPLSETGTERFDGTFSVDGIQGFIRGDASLDLIPVHPADAQPVDSWLTIREMTAYGAAWKRGTNWQSGPNPISAAYLAQAIVLWGSGEYYRYDTNSGDGPYWWVNSASGTNSPPLPPAAGTLATNGVAAADMPLSVTPGTKFRVTITVTPSTNVAVYAVEDQPPAGWEVSEVGGDGHFDRGLWKVKWGPFFDHLARTNSYWVTVAASATATNKAVFAGVAAFDGCQGQITGQREVRLDGGSLASSLVTRALPAGYSPGMKMVVRLQVVPLTNHLFYTVEDLPPTGWLVGQISDDGTVGSTSRNVRFGPFFDGQARVLSYELTPPLSETGTERFSGTFSVDGIQGVTGGDTSLDLIPVHPADAQPIDSWLTIREMTAYGAAWKRGTNWQSGPNPIPAAYLTQAIDLWRSGEGYRYDTNSGDGPYWWVSTTAGAEPPASYPDSPSPSSIASNGIVTAEMPAAVPPGRSVTVILSALPATNVVVYAIEDEPPAGWQVNRVNDGGFYDPVRRKVKWGPFFDHVPRDVSYSVQGPSNASGLATFSGTAAFDAAQGAVGGARQVVVTSGGTLDSFVSRILPPGYMPGARSVVTLQAAPPPQVGYYVVEDAPPSGWVVGPISEDGVYDTGSGTVKFGPFFDGAPRTLTYEVTPPASESGLRVFEGVSLADDLEGVVVGDAALNVGMFHPADIDPSDSWVTINEMTAYGAAWKRGATWPMTSAAVPTPYLTRAIELWAGGERYGLDQAVTNAPRWWVNLTNAPGDGPIPPGIVPGSSSTNGLAQVDLPRLFRRGLPLTVTITVSPGTNVTVYAVEDRPPEGWLVSQADQNGFYDPRCGKVKWGPFFDAVTRTFSYQVLPPSGAGSIAAFYGGVSFDGDTAEFVGRRQTFLKGDGAPVPRFEALRLVPGGVELTMEGAVGEAYGLEQSTNLVNWKPLASVTNTTSLLQYIDTAATNSPMRFYRVFWK